MNADPFAASHERPRACLPARTLARLRIALRHVLLGLTAALFMPLVLHAQGFAGMGGSAEGFSLPDPDRVFEFPADHGPHPDFRIEWWYVTANLDAPDGTEYGLQWTLFRLARSPEGGAGWEATQLWMGHAAVTTPDAHFAAERLARGGIGQAGVIAAPFAAWIDEWRMEGPHFDDLRLTARGTDFAFDVALSATGPLVLHGDAGFSVKTADGRASHYYSQPFFEVAGTLSLPDGDIAVTGNGWLDREWSSQPLGEDQTGWDWFSLSFDDGDKMMGFRLRQTDGPDFAVATWIAADGTTTTYPDGAFLAVPLELAQVETPLGPRPVPVRWQVQLADRGVDVTVEALNPQAWMDVSVPYWEGPVHVDGSHRGRGYLEMTGYE
jgi:predicted secreted hydrolase